ncbi:MAG: Rieske 2Fe-2S domain-containing protein [Chloroflexi bacterium]|nr:Rieske 2Fe-2S domain-containing protein [Chloroflexota bacterium]
MTVSTNKPAPSRSLTTQSSKTNVKVPEEQVSVPLPNRREFLFYIWGASLTLFAAASGGFLYWFLKPRFSEGEFGGVFREPPTSVPESGNAPFNNPTGKYWLSNSQEGVVALYKVCTHLGCLYAWVPNNDRFECPCHGSMFELWGEFIQGPAPRSLDRFAMTITTTSGAELVTNEAGDPIPVTREEIAEIMIDTGNRIKRDGRV